MKKYLEFNDEKSSKFWQIEVEGNTHTVKYGKIGTKGQTNTKIFTDKITAVKAAKKLISTKIKKGYLDVENKNGERLSNITKALENNLLLQLTEKEIVSKYKWEGLGEDHSNCPKLLEELENSDVATVTHVINTTLTAFTFEQGGVWCPSWMEITNNSRKLGSPLYFLKNALDILFKKDIKSWVEIAGISLPYILCEGEALDHDPDFEMWDTYTDVSNKLIPYFEKADNNFPIEKILINLERQLEIISTSNILQDPFTLVFALIKSNIGKKYKQEVIHLLTKFLNQEFNMLDFIKRNNSLTTDNCKKYADILLSSEVSDKLLTGLAISIFQQETNEISEFFCGAICGNDATDFYFPILNKKDNSYCAIVHYKNGNLSEVGRFPIIPKVMEYSNEGLYFVLKKKIYRYSDTKWFFEFEADFDIYQLKLIDNTLYALGNGSNLFYKTKGNWKSLQLPKDYSYSKIAKSPNGNFWVSGAKGILLQIDSLKNMTMVKPVDKVKINYRLAATQKALYLHAKTGLYRMDLAKPKKLVAGNFKFSAISEDYICAVSDNLVVFVANSKIINKITISGITAMGSSSNSIGFSIKDRILLLIDNKWKIIVPEVKKSDMVNLPVVNI
ncbi:MAG: WGR domain-containing protein [Flavobacteriaceae bacterium]|nr:WGR domain-containing protein [Flavobacteriaceae bacterium]